VASRILSIAQVADLTGLSHRSIYTAVEFEKFPRQIQLTSRRVGWIESEIEEWIESRIAKRDGVAAS
jgi:prophage regulatory protein